MEGREGEMMESVTTERENKGIIRALSEEISGSQRKTEPPSSARPSNVSCQGPQQPPIKAPVSRRLGAAPQHRFTRPSLPRGPGRNGPRTSTFGSLSKPFPVLPVLRHSQLDLSWSTARVPRGPQQPRMTPRRVVSFLP